MQLSGLPQRLLLLTGLAATSWGALAVASWLPSGESQCIFSADEMQQMWVDSLQATARRVHTHLLHLISSCGCNEPLQAIARMCQN